MTWPEGTVVAGVGCPNSKPREVLSICNPYPSTNNQGECNAHTRPAGSTLKPPVRRVGSPTTTPTLLLMVRGYSYMEKNMSILQDFLNYQERHRGGTDIGGMLALLSFLMEREDKKKEKKDEKKEKRVLTTLEMGTFLFFAVWPVALLYGYIILSLIVGIKGDANILVK
jgi:hypothetical protein